MGNINRRRLRRLRRDAGSIPGAGPSAMASAIVDAAAFTAATSMDELASRAVMYAEATLTYAQTTSDLM